MHRTALQNAQLFFDVYVRPLGRVKVVEIGSQDVNGSIRHSFKDVDYVGVDFAEGNGVDVVLTDPYSFPFADDEADVVVTSSCFEHSEFFWLTFVEAVRIVKPGGLIYLNAPSNGPVHGYPVDCWRFYPDSGRALARWAVRQGHDVVELESYTSDQVGGYWNDYVAVFLKDASKLAAYPDRMQARIKAFSNGRQHGSEEVQNPQQLTEDQRVMKGLQQHLQPRLQPI
jgi:SAM-dependent methyltransferase